MKKLISFFTVILIIILLPNLSFAYHPLPYYGVENEQYNTATENYISPHLKWAKPYIAGRARVLILAPRWGMREAIELTQRMDLNATIFAVASQKEFGIEREDGGESWDGFSFHTRTQQLEALVRQDWDAVICAGFEMRSLPGGITGVISNRVANEGKGLLVMPDIFSGPVLTHHDNIIKERILKSIPVDNVPVMKSFGKDSLLITTPLGKGRIANLRIGGGSRGCFTSGVSDPVDFEYCFALVIRTLEWVLGKEPPVEIASAEWQRSIDNKKQEEVKIIVDRNKVIGLTPCVEILRKGERNLYAARVPSDIKVLETSNGYVFSIPRLPEGEYFFNFRLNAENSQVVWYSGAFTVTSSESIEFITTDKEFYRRNEILKVRVNLRGAEKEGSSVIVSLIDGFGRIMMRKKINVPLGKNIAEFDIPLENVLHNALTIQAELYDNTGMVSSRKKEIYAPATGQDDFFFVMWEYGESRDDRVTQLLGGRMWDTYLVDVIDANDNEKGLQALMRANLRPMPYITRYSYDGGNPLDTKPIRQPSLTDPQFRQEEKNKLQTTARLAKNFSPSAYTLGDENFLARSSGTRGIDVDFHPSSLEIFRRFLMQKYGSLAKLNEVWGTAFQSLEAVMPITQVEALRSGQYARWIDFRLHMDNVFTDIHRWAGDMIREVDPGARVGFDGTFHLNSYNGYNFYDLLQVNGVQNIYDKREQREILRSFAQKDALTGIWLGSYWAHRSEDQQRHYPWLMLLHGFTSCWYWKPYGEASYGYTMEAIAPDLTPTWHFQWSLEELKEIKSGIGKLLMNSERLHDGIAIHYSQASLHASSLDRTMSFVPESQSNFVTLLEDAGFQYEFIATPQIEKGILDLGKYKILILPCSQIISGTENKAIRKFVENGGVLIADVRPGYYGSYGNSVNAGILDDVFGIAKMKGERTVPCDLEVSGIMGKSSLRLILPKRSLDASICSRGGTALASYEGVSAVIVNHYGKGQAILFNFDISDYVGSTPLPVVFPVPMEGALRERGQDDGLKTLIRSCLSLAGIQKRLILETGSGECKATETMFFKDGENEYLGILRSHHTEDLIPHKTHITLPDIKHVYDARKGTYLGETNEITTTIEPARALLFSLLPYRVDAINLKVPEMVLRGSTLIISMEIHTNRGVPGKHVINLKFHDPEENEVLCYNKNIMVPGDTAITTIPIALNDNTGNWLITARDAATGKMAEVTFEVR